MRYNDNSIEIPEVITDVTTEPVTLEDVKRQLNLLFDTDGSYEFNDDDSLLAQDIKAAREAIENYTGLSLATKTLRTIVRNELGGVEIPYGPIQSVTTIKDNTGTTVTPTLSGNQFKTIDSPCSCYLLLDYVAGYANGKLPAQLKQAVIEEAVFRYTHRGDQQQEYAAADVSLCTSSLNLAAPFKRKSILV
ncbi:head-tail connector protein [Paraflavitalea pollutisoli]|uniref:head-tail connector protein n=1 Tax=Paraflavitalea pollutisoli TaxID=3034143 RepID=UPI0023EB8DBA|nr:phage head-tail connector protein [Paraflavitalea sp. H1-2-19X]